MREVQLGGKTLPAHAQICVLFASANGDDSVFGCPRSLDLARGNSGNHLTFGAGIHRCIGASLARMELRVAAEEIIRRLDHIKLTIPVGSEEHTSELQSLMRISYAVFCLKKKNKNYTKKTRITTKPYQI